MSDWYIQFQQVADSAVESLVQTRTINGLEYGVVAVSGPKVDDRYVPDVSQYPFVGMGFWPGGITPLAPFQSCIFRPGQTVAELQEPMHGKDDMILDIATKGRIGAYAMEYYMNSQYAETERLFARGLGGLTVPNILANCARAQAPLSLLAASGSETEGYRANLFFYAGAPVEAVFAGLKDAAFRLKAPQN